MSKPTAQDLLDMLHLAKDRLQKATQCDELPESVAYDCENVIGAIEALGPVSDEVAQAPASVRCPCGATVELSSSVRCVSCRALTCPQCSKPNANHDAWCLPCLRDVPRAGEDEEPAEEIPARPFLHDATTLARDLLRVESDLVRDFSAPDHDEDGQSTPRFDLVNALERGGLQYVHDVVADSGSPSRPKLHDVPDLLYWAQETQGLDGWPGELLDPPPTLITCSCCGRQWSRAGWQSRPWQGLIPTGEGDTYLSCRECTCGGQQSVECTPPVDLRRPIKLGAVAKESERQEIGAACEASLRAVRS